MSPATRSLPLLVLLALLGSATHAQSVVRTWVASSGIDNPSCSRSAPCRTLGAAVAAVDPGGEVVVLESGGYGPFTIDKSVTVIAPAGIHASIAPTSQTAIEIAASSMDIIRLVNLHLVSQGSARGIHVAGSTVHVEDCSVTGFSGEGFLQDYGMARISDSVFIGCQRGIHIVLGHGLIVRSKLDRNTYGITSRGDNDSGGGGATVVVESTAVTGGTTAFYANRGGYVTALMMIRSSIAANATTGVHANNGASVWLSDTTIVSNGTGVAVGSSATIYTGGNNIIYANATDLSGSLTPLAWR